MTLGSRRAASRLFSALALGLCFCAPTASAQEPDAGTRMAARELAMSGAEAFDKQDFTTALDRFQRAESLYKVPSISVMLARCYARVGRVVEAVDKYEETLRVPLDAAAPEAFQRAVADATAEVEAARARVARLELRLPADAPAGAVVTLDDRRMPPALLGVPTPVNPGAHHLAARAPGRAPYAFDVVLPEGGRQSVEISLELLSKQATPVTPPEARATGHRRSPLAIVLLTGGGLGIAAGAATGIAALNHKSNLDAACKPGCPANLAGELSAFRRDRTLSYLGFGVGLAAAGAGAYFLLHEGVSGNEVGALVLPGGAAVTGSF
jgi:hypothetical protein